MKILVGLLQISLKSYAIELTLNKREKMFRAVGRSITWSIRSGVVLRALMCITSLSGPNLAEVVGKHIELKFKKMNKAYNLLRFPRVNKG